MRVNLHEPTFGEEEIQAVVEVMRSGWVTSGERVRAFEDKFGNNSVMCNSGSSANLLAVAALCETRLNPGDEILVPALSWSTTVWPLVQHGLIPKIVDIDPYTLNIDMNKAEITNRTKGMMIVHVYGNPCDMNKIMTLRAEGLCLIEDCCEALGARWLGRSVGTFGDVATFSFYFSHHITTCEGGLCTTGSFELAETIRALRAHGWIRDMRNGKQHAEQHPDIDPKFLFISHGYNLRCTEMQAAMGLVQLEKLEGFVLRRQQIADHLKRIVSKYPHLSMQKENGDSSWFGFPIIVNGAPFTAKELRAHLEKHQIETRSIICGNIARQPGIKKWPHVICGSLKNADKVMRDGFSIGCHQNMMAAHCEYIEEVLDDFMRPYL